ncbi:hypothetical protein D3C73_1344080 [compost metagenome]
MAQVDNEQHQLQCLPFGKVLLDHLAPCRPLHFGHLRIAVARKIHEIQALINAVIVHMLRFARRGAGAGQILPVDHPVDQGGLPHIGAPGKGDFRQSILRILSRPDGTDHKFGRGNFHRTSFLVRTNNKS